MKKIFLFFIVLVFSGGCEKQKNIALFIGDGMGPAYITAARIYQKENNKTLHLDSLPSTAIVQTYSSDCLVTDSAAAATAFGCGVKTINDVVGQDSTALLKEKDGNLAEERQSGANNWQY